MYACTYHIRTYFHICMHVRITYLDDSSVSLLSKSIEIVSKQNSPGLIVEGQPVCLCVCMYACMFVYMTVCMYARA